MIAPGPRLRRNTRAAPVRAPQADPLTAYSQRMNRVLDHIDAHLDDSLSLAALAEVAHFSATHFHRVFSAWMGETLGQYLQRRRLDIAAIRLAGQRETPVLHIALAVGFASGEAFTRAFKARFGQTPSAWRAQTPVRWGEELWQARRKSNLDQVDRKNPDHNGAAPQTAKENAMLTVEIRNLAPARIAYLRHIGPYGPEIGRFWQQEFFPWMQANGLTGRDCYGVGHDDPHITAPEHCRYDACVAVPEDFVARGQAGIATLPGGRYACARYRGDGPGIGRAWVELLREWLPQSGQQIDSRPLFEHYPVGSHYNPQTGEFECLLCVPIKAL